MKFTRYSKFNGLDVSSLNLGDLMEALSDSLLYSGYDDDYYWTRQRTQQDTTLDALRRALLQALMDQGLLEQWQIQEMLAENEGQFKGSQLDEMLNQLIERLVEEEKGHVERGNVLLDELLNSKEKHRRASDWQAHLEELLGASGGVTGFEAEAPEPRRKVGRS